jgi:hypothetical protein
MISEFVTKCGEVLDKPKKTTGLCRKNPLLALG